jgi:hypothetical protein
VLDLKKNEPVPITLHVDSYSTASEVRELAKILGDRGQAQVAAQLAVVKPHGWISVGNMMGFMVPVIRVFETDKGTEIFAVLDRPFPIFDQLQGTTSPDFRYGMVKLLLGVDGTNKGELIAASRALFADDGKVSLEAYGTKPYQIIGIAEQRSK